ncbi:MAG: cell division protein ZapE [Gammaproteobacteria bacterium]|jgi:cell division protein ZapE|nr:cell division protein ZapE [Gammaproteobacteria bacterium]
MSAPPAPGPLQRYRDLVEAGRLQPDPAQERIAELLQSCHDRLVADLNRPWWQRLRPRPAIPGLYLHGGVGRGKTLLMNLLATGLAENEVPVWRTHFHRFMDDVHGQLGRLGGQSDPLRRIGRRMAARVHVLCLDEFQVSDIGDAMILGELLRTLFDRGLTLVTTSNTRPDALYADGLQRERFIPAIEALEAHCRVVALDAREDYRLRELIRHPVYYHPDNDDTERQLLEEFEGLASGEAVSTAPLDIRGRRIEPRRRAGSVVWFDFATLCAGPRSSSDYIELARRFGTLFISSVPRMDDSTNDPARRFIHLIDECYDRSVKLILSAEVPLTELYVGKRLADPFERTRSRLIEMQSRNYLARAHEPI